MSTIQLAAHRSLLSGEPVRFAWRRPRLGRVLFGLLSGLSVILCLLIAGLYAHIYHNLQHPAQPAAQHSADKSDAVLSSMHYVYVTKPFPASPSAMAKLAPTAPSTEPNYSDDVPPVVDERSDADWTHTPDGDLATQPLPSAQTESSTPSSSLQERLMQALKEQQKEYKESDQDQPAALSDTQNETQNDVQNEAKNQSSAPALSRQPAAIQQLLPDMQYQSHIYSSEPQNSKVVLNGQTYRTGDRLAKNVTIRAIEQQSLVVNIQGTDYTIPSLINWESAKK
jgi:hypothetical protein